MEEDKWIKGVVNTQICDVPSKLERKEEIKDYENAKDASYSNLGLNLIQRVFHKAK